MPQVFGLTDKGFKTKTLPDIKAEIEARLLATVDPTLRFDVDSVTGMITAIIANQVCQVWESLSGLYHSLQPETATGRALDALCSLTGTYRNLASKSQATSVLTVEAKITVPQHTRLQTINGDFFTTSKEVSNTSNDPMDIGVRGVTERKTGLSKLQSIIYLIYNP